MSDTWWWRLHVSAVFVYFTIQNDIRTVDCSAKNTGDGISGDRKLKSAEIHH